MDGCVFFTLHADSTVVMPLFLLIAILLLCRNVGVGMLRFGWSSRDVITERLAMAEQPTFDNVFRSPVSKSVPQIRSHFINNKGHTSLNNVIPFHI